MTDQSDIQASARTQHTPGPWTFAWQREHNRHVLASMTQGNFGHFCGWSDDGVTTEAEDEANLRLIAAAPELYAAAKVVVLDSRLGQWLLNNDPKAYDQITAAIAKAEGKETR